MSLQTKGIIGFVVLLILSFILWKVVDYADTAGYNRAVGEQTALIEESNKRAAKFETELNELKATTEEDVRKKLEVLVNYYLDGVEDAKNTADDIIRDVRNDNIRLSVNLKRTKAAADECNLRTGSDSPGGNNETERAELSREDGDFFIRFATEADDAVRQLTACQSLVSAYEEQALHFKKVIQKYRKENGH